MRLVVGDMKIFETPGGKLIADAKAFNNYYPFGMLQPGRTYQSDEYRFGFQGMEQDDELKGEGNSYTTEYRQYDSRIGQWLSIDPLAAFYSSVSPYTAFANNPIYYADPLGLAPGDHKTINGEIHVELNDGSYQKVQEGATLTLDRPVDNSQAASAAAGTLTLTGSYQSYAAWEAMRNVARYAAGAALEGAGAVAVPVGAIGTFGYIYPYFQDIANIGRPVDIGYPPLAPPSPTAALNDAMHAIALEAAAAAIAVTTSEEIRRQIALRKVDELVAASALALSQRPAYVYSLRVIRAGWYQSVSGRQVYLETGEVWKYGKSVEPAGRYSPSSFELLNFRLQPEAGPLPELKALAVEKLLILSYLFDPQNVSRPIEKGGTLIKPAGNRIYR